ncbi:hypothetical protein MF672_014035 [Actinomadura sp. ATCC 31491]|uniref:Ribbon-helix-helix protein, CopG family n=1 Tax=Actinomadura luzonensis TaxID=2805427 RepID=A0ABT0FRF9_9ACTN|nr:hypothetical protein [Actinomadura luzonensis]MCK2214897.1 hypothetical protein [Actinomadura luzonensis]
MSRKTRRRIGYITFRSDAEAERALDVLTQDGNSRSAAIRQAVLEAALRKKRPAAMRRAVLRIGNDLLQPPQSPQGRVLRGEVGSLHPE